MTDQYLEYLEDRIGDLENQLSVLMGCLTLIENHEDHLYATVTIPVTKKGERLTIDFNRLIRLSNGDIQVHPIPLSLAALLEPEIIFHGSQDQYQECLESLRNKKSENIRINPQRFKNDKL